MSLISLILPSYNEEENIDNTVKVLTETLSGEDFDYELVFVNDGSKDGTYEKIRQASKKDSRVKGISFSRNFGKEAAIFAGLSVATGDACVVLDCDLQHPPKTIHAMVEKWREGYDVIEGIKTDRGRESLFHKLAAGTFYKIMSKLIKMDMRATSDFKLLDRKVVDELNKLKECNTFFRALSFWVGFKTAKVEYEVQERQFGNTKWSLKSLARYAINNATSFSTLPLEVVTYLGVGITFLGIVVLIDALISYFKGVSASGYPSIMIMLLLIGGSIMTSLGIIGHYIAKIYEEVKGRPKYIISEHTDNIMGNI